MTEHQSHGTDRTRDRRRQAEGSKHISQDMAGEKREYACIGTIHLSHERAHHPQDHPKLPTLTRWTFPSATACGRCCPRLALSLPSFDSVPLECTATWSTARSAPVCVTFASGLYLRCDVDKMTTKNRHGGDIIKLEEERRLPARTADAPTRRAYGEPTLVARPSHHVSNSMAREFAMPA